MYHNFPAKPDATVSFDDQCRHLSERYTPLSMSAVALALKDGRLPPNAVAVTVDDGYRDFYLTAWPVLRRYRIPATVYLMTDFLDGCTWPWWNQLQFAFEKTGLKSITLDGAGVLPLGSREERLQSYYQVSEYLKTIPNQARLRFMADLPRCLETEIPVTPPQGLEPMSWSEVREMAAGGVEFGAHTKSHPILSCVETEAELREEIRGSKARVAEELGREPVHFCYPNGRPSDIRHRARAIVEECGFTTAVTAEVGLNEPRIDRLLLRRIGCEPDDPRYYFRQQVSGFRI
jgi:peptidoglycan/xylan/chitin deacetylase (PgdA/CDA1 family)